MASLMVPDNLDFPGTIDELMNRPSWHRWAACRGQGTDAFIAGRGGNYRPARTMCAECSVRAECLEAALADDELVGLWGGTTEKERARMRRATEVLASSPRPAHRPRLPASIEDPGQGAEKLVEVAGFEPASSGVSIGLLRAQPALDCRGRHHCRRLCRPVANEDFLNR